MAREVNLKLQFKQYVHDDDKELEGIALLKTGELAVVGKYNDLGGVCDCCKNMDPEEDILIFAEIDLATLENLEELRTIVEVHRRHNA
ncbi:hypothetical protein pD_gene0042 [Vibrio phage 033B]|nr:hypothetical protein pD_gene0042 [Vibrio phage 033B]